MEVGDLLEHKRYPALGVIVAFHEWSPKSQFGRNVLINWFFAPPTLYFPHASDFPKCHYDAGCEQRIANYFDVIGHIELEGTDGSSAVSR